MNQGIYKIQNTINKKSYIGQSINLFGKHGRLADHRSDLRKNTHENPHLQTAWNKYGEQAFCFEVILICEPKFLSFYEDKIIELYKKDLGVYNIREVDLTKVSGYRQSEETKEKIRQKRSLQIITEETKRKISESGRNRKWKPSDEHKNKMVQARIASIHFKKLHLIDAKSLKCKKCEQEKDVNNFHRNKRMVSGRLNVCKECIKK